MIRLSIYIRTMYVCMYHFVSDVYCMYVSSLLFTFIYFLKYMHWFNNGWLSGGPVFSAHT